MHTEDAEATIKTTFRPALCQRHRQEQGVITTTADIDKSRNREEPPQRLT